MLAFASVQRQIAAPTGRRSFGILQGSAAGAGLPHVSIRQIVLVRMGDEAARQELLEAWLPLVKQEARRYARAGGSEEELAAEGALALWEGVLQYDPQRHRTAPERYLHNQIHRRVRRSYREAMGYAGGKVVPVESLEQEMAAEEGYGAAERQVDMAGALAALKPAERMQFEQYLGLALAGMGPDEAARAMASQSGVSFAAGKKRLERIRRRVKERLSL